MTIQENNFIPELIKGNQKALLYVVDNYGWVIKTVLSKHMYKIPWYIDECTNDVLMAVWQNADRYDPSRGTFSNWLAGVSRYTALNYIKKYQKEMITDALDESVVDKSQENLAFNIEFDEEFNRLIECLNPRDKLIFTNLFKNNYSLDEVSEESGLSKDVLYNRISRGKQKIKKFLAN